MSEIIEEYRSPYIGYDLSHGDHLEGYTIRKLSSGDLDIYIEIGNQVTGGAYTAGRSGEDLAGKTFEEIVALLPNFGEPPEDLHTDLKKDPALKRFFGFSE